MPRNAGIQVLSESIRDQARFIAETLGIKDFEASDKWLTNFKSLKDINLNISRSRLRIK